MVKMTEKTSNNENKFNLIDWLTEDDSPEIGIASKEPLKDYIEGVKTEFNKIEWPSKEQVSNELITVLVIGAAISVLVYLIDIGIDKLIKFFG